MLLASVGVIQPALVRIAQWRPFGDTVNASSFWFSFGAAQLLAVKRPLGLPSRGTTLHGACLTALAAPTIRCESHGYRRLSIRPECAAPGRGAGRGVPRASRRARPRGAPRLRPRQRAFG